MTNCRGRLRALVLELHRKSRAKRVSGVESRLAKCLAPHGRVEGAIEDSPGPISSWRDQNPKGQPQAHSRSALVALMLANPLRLYEAVRDDAPSRQRRQDERRVAMRDFRNKSFEAPTAAAPALGARDRIAWTNAPDCSWQHSASPGS
jgi:hypothetical protein